MKRGQVTVYMVVGLVILIVFGLVFYYRDIIFKSAAEQKQVEITSVPEQFTEVQQQIKTCADQFVLDSIYNLGVYGGYLYRDKLDKIDYLGVNLTYLHYGKTNYVPATAQMDQELSRFINENILFNCKVNVTNIDVNYGKIDSQVDIKDSTINININWPIKLTKGTVTSEIDKISLSYPIKLGGIRNVIDSMVKQQIKDKPQLCMTCMARAAQTNNLFINTYNQGNDIIFLVTDMKQVKDFELYKFWYVGDYK